MFTSTTNNQKKEMTIAAAIMFSITALIIGFLTGIATGRRMEDDYIRKLEVKNEELAAMLQVKRHGTGSSWLK